MLHTISTRTSTATRHPGDRGRARAMVAALVMAVLLTGCGSRPASSAAASADSESPAVVATEMPSPADPAVVARAGADVRVHDVPDGAVTQVLPAATGFGTPTVLLVSQVGSGRDDGWLEVLLPVRPNGATGWISADEVEIRDVSLEVEVDLAARELTVRDAGIELLTTATAIGESDNPTPTGRFFVIDKLETPDPSGAYGPYAIGLSAHSEVLTEFGGGDGQIGIHGTNAPDSIGRPVSHGCLRVDNAVIARLADLLPLGTPVTIV